MPCLEGADWFPPTRHLMIRVPQPRFVRLRKDVGGIRLGHVTSVIQTVTLCRGVSIRIGNLHNRKALMCAAQNLCTTALDLL
jgi:hypothetical protein